MGVLDTFGKKWMGDNEYNAEVAPLNTEKADQEQALGLETRQGQQSLGNYYRGVLSGRGPTVAGQQMQQGIAAAGKQARATAASARGATAGLATRAAATGAGQVAMQGAGQAAMLRAQEQQAAAGQYQQLLQTQRMQDLLARGYSIDEAKAQLQADVARTNNLTTIKEGNATRGQKGAGGIVMTGGALLGLSDERAKTNVQPLGMSNNYMTMDAAQSPDYGGVQATQQAASTTGTQNAPPPSFGEQLLSRLGGAAQTGGGALQGSDPMMTQIESQQKQASMADYQMAPTSQSQQGGGGLDLSSILSDKRNKTEIRDLEAEFADPNSKSQRVKEGLEAFMSLNPELQKKIFSATQSDEHDEKQHTSAAVDYARKYQDFLNASRMAGQDVERQQAYDRAESARTDLQAGLQAGQQFPPRSTSQPAPKRRPVVHAAQTNNYEMQLAPPPAEPTNEEVDAAVFGSLMSDERAKVVESQLGQVQKENEVLKNFLSMSPSLQSGIFKATIPPKEMKDNRAEIHKKAADDYAKQYKQMLEAKTLVEEDIANQKAQSTMRPKIEAAIMEGSMRPDLMIRPKRTRYFGG